MARHVDRTGLYILVFILLWKSCSMQSDLADVKRDLDKIDRKVSNIEVHFPFNKNNAAD